MKRIEKRPVIIALSFLAVTLLIISAILIFISFNLDNEDKKEENGIIIIDTDGDGVADEIDPHPNDATDTDNDGWSDDYENVISHTNASYPDTDGDGFLDPDDPDPLEKAKFGDENSTDSNINENITLSSINELIDNPDRYVNAFINVSINVSRVEYFNENDSFPYNHMWTIYDFEGNSISILSLNQMSLTQAINHTLEMGGYWKREDTPSKNVTVPFYYFELWFNHLKDIE